MDGRQFAFFDNIAKCLFVVHNRLGITHQNNIRIAACHGCRSAGQDILLGGKTGVAEMGMCIHQTGKNIKSRGIQLIRILITGRFRLFREHDSINDPVFHKDCGVSFKGCARIYNIAAERLTCKLN